MTFLQVLTKKTNPEMILSNLKPRLKAAPHQEKMRASPDKHHLFLLSHVTFRD